MPGLAWVLAMSRKPKDKCPLCSAPSAADHAPFCSRGCKDRDLLNWLGEGYRIPERRHEEQDSDFRDES